MSKNIKNLTNPSSSGGLGHVFEIQVQTSFALLMLANGVVPGLPSCSIERIKLQGRYKGFHTDDFIAYASGSSQSTTFKFLAQIKLKFSFTERDSICRQVVSGLWNDFKNKKLFIRQHDALAIITGPLSQIDTKSVRPLLERARVTDGHKEFFDQINLGNFTSDSMRTKLNAIRTHIDTANGSAASDEEVWIFLRHLHLLGYDLDIKAGVVQALCHSMIRFHTKDDAAGVWGTILHEVMYANANAGTLIRENFPADLVALFEWPSTQHIPGDIAKGIAPPSVDFVNQIPDEHSEPLALAALLGSWSDRSTADKEVLDRLAKVFDGSN